MRIRIHSPDYLMIFSFLPQDVQWAEVQRAGLWQHLCGGPHRYGASGRPPASTGQGRLPAHRLPAPPTTPPGSAGQLLHIWGTIFTEKIFIFFCLWHSITQWINPQLFAHCGKYNKIRTMCCCLSRFCALDTLSPHLKCSNACSNIIRVVSHLRVTTHHQRTYLL